MEWDQIGLVVALAAGTAFATHLMFQRRAPKPALTWDPLSQAEDRAVFLFDGEDLVDASESGQALLRSGPNALEGWAKLRALLEPRFPGCGTAVAELPDRLTLRIEAKDSGAVLTGEWRGGLIRLSLTEREDCPGSERVDGLSVQAMTDELATLRQGLDLAPLPIWRETREGEITWANAAYLDLAQRVDPSLADSNIPWPLPKVFTKPAIVGPGAGAPRLFVNLPDQTAPLWFEMSSKHLDEDRLIHAMPIDALVKTEASLQEFLQTLTKTFAHLPTGLAVFDRSRCLALFNPALTDLSGLPPEFLSARPTLFAFLDRLRETRRMPEPKDYRSWRRQIMEMEQAASTGTHQETWTLPSGQTYRVTGRPHPEGAVAFLFEDISTEVAATRHFRAEQELSQAVLDSLDEAIAVFSSTGTLLQANAAYGVLWGRDVEESIQEVTLADAMSDWLDACEDTEVWVEMARHLRSPRGRTPWIRQVWRKGDPTPLTCAVVPLPGASCRISFRMGEMSAPVAQLALPPAQTAAE